MSMSRCYYCSNIVDTDEDPGCFDQDGRVECGMCRDDREFATQADAVNNEAWLEREARQIGLAQPDSP